MITVKIYNGPHYSDRVVLEYSPVGDFETVECGARSMCGSLEETVGRRVWVDFLDEDGAPITHRIFQEGYVELDWEKDLFGG